MKRFSDIADKEYPDIEGDKARKNKMITVSNKEHSFLRNLYTKIKEIKINAAFNINDKWNSFVKSELKQKTDRIIE